MDVEAIKVIASYEGSTLKDEPWSYTQIKQAKTLCLDVKSEAEYIVLTELRTR